MKYTLICDYDTQETKIYKFTTQTREEADNVSAYIILNIAFNDDINYVAFYEDEKLLHYLNYNELLWCSL